MLREWLAPGTLEDFARSHLRRLPEARPSSARAVTSLFTWETFGRVLGSDPAPDVLVVDAGRELAVAPPRDLATARGLFREGAGFVVRRAERHDPGLRALAESFAKDLPGEVHLQLFVTPAGRHGFAWHYDFEEVFIAQTAGVKDYYFRPNTVDLDTPLGAQPDFAAYRRETSPMGAARLGAGDWLYLPGRWWHVAKCVEDSLSISVGVLPARP